MKKIMPNLAISEGWMDTPANRSQRRAPFNVAAPVSPLLPMNSTMMSSTMDTIRNMYRSLSRYR